MKFSLVEIVPAPDDYVFKLFPASQLPNGAKIKKWDKHPTHFILNIFSHILSKSLVGVALGLFLYWEALPSA